LIDRGFGDVLSETRADREMRNANLRGDQLRLSYTGS
jgi:hypothetical protein